MKQRDGKKRRGSAEENEKRKGKKEKKKSATYLSLFQPIRPSTAAAMHVRRQVRVSSSGALHCRRLKPTTSTPIPSRSPSTALLPLGLPFTPLSHPVAVPQAWSSRSAGVLAVGKLNPTVAAAIRPAGTSNCWGDAETAAAASPNPKSSAGFGVTCECLLPFVPPLTQPSRRVDRPACQGGRLALPSPPRTTFDRLADRLGQNRGGRPPPRPDFCNTASDYDLTMVIACLNLQGFRKVDPDRWEFANEGFLRGQRHLLKMIKRRKPLHCNVPPAQQQALTSCLEVGEFGYEEEIDRLKRDKNILITEVVKLRQEQQATKDHVQAMEERLRAAEQKQVQMMGFLARAMRNPEFFQQLVHQQDKRKELEDAISKKRRRPIENVPFYSPEETSQSKQLESPFLFDSGVLNKLTEPGIPELENLALNIHDQASGQAELNDDFWAELLVADFRDKAGKSELDGRSTEDVDELAQQLGYLSSTSPK